MNCPSRRLLPIEPRKRPTRVTLVYYTVHIGKRNSCYAHRSHREEERNTGREKSGAGRKVWLAIHIWSCVDRHSLRTRLLVRPLPER
jgi:hypothetical protein